MSPAKNGTTHACPRRQRVNHGMLRIAGNAKPIDKLQRLPLSLYAAVKHVLTSYRGRRKISSVNVAVRRRNSCSQAMELLQIPLRKRHADRQCIRTFVIPRCFFLEQRLNQSMFFLRSPQIGEQPSEEALSRVSRQNSS